MTSPKASSSDKVAADAGGGGFFDQWVHVQAIALLRVLVGPVVLVHLYPFWSDVAVYDFYFADHFFVPFFDWWPVLSAGAYAAVLSVGLVSAVLMSLGLVTRLACLTTLSVVAFNVLSNQLFFHHNRAFLMAILFGLTLNNSGRALSLDAWIAKRRGRPLQPLTPRWRLALLRVLACTPYLASGFSKLIDPDWWGGTVMQLRIERYRSIAEERGVPPWLIDPLGSDIFNSVMWKFVVLTELFIGIGYWFGRTRTAALFMALGFHVFIEITSTVSVFSYLGICATLIWVVPKTRDRVLWLKEGDPAAERIRRRVRWLDWLARFDVRTRAKGPVIEMIDRDGTAYIGKYATRKVCSRLPLLAPLYIPTLMLRPRKA